METRSQKKKTEGGYGNSLKKFPSNEERGNEKSAKRKGKEGGAPIRSRATRNRWVGNWKKKKEG